MYTSKITNIVLNQARFRVFLTIESEEETINEENIFMPEVVAQDILDWQTERENYYNELKAKEEALKEELL